MAEDVTKICDPDLYPLSEAIEHARTGAEASPGFEIDIVRYLQSQCRSERVSLPIVFRGLDVLGGMLGSGTPNESRLIALLRPFLRSDNPRIASKCVLVLGRQSCSTKWLNDIMGELDGRMRANLIESLWKRKEPEIEMVLRKALLDPHPRVAANAVHGLFLLGDEAWAEGLRRLMGSHDPAFRISGIWVLKSSGAPDAPEKIKRLIRDEDPRVRRAAFDAIKHFREHGAAA
jgi:HEAT repeat protein